MNTNLGYSKRTLTNTDVLLSGGGNKPLSEFIGSISWDATNRKIKYTPVGGSVTDLVTFSSLAITNYSLPKATTSALGGIIVSNVLTAAVTLTSANGTTANRYYGVQLDKDGKAFVNIPWVWNAFTAATSSAAGTAGYIQAPKGAQSKFFRGDNTWLSITSNVTTSLYFGASNGTANAEVAATPYIILKEGSSYTRYKLEGAGGITVSSDASGNVKFTGTTYSVFTGATADAAGSIGLVKLPAKGDQGKFLRGDCTWQSLTSNVTTALYVGASNGTSTAAQSTNGNVYLILKEGSSYTRYNIVGSGRASVTSDANGKITINSSGYSNFTAATASAAGSAGLVPGPAANQLGSGGYYLKADGTWNIPTNTWKEVSTSQEGYVPKIVTTGSLTSSDNPFILVYKNVSGTTKSIWVPLPANAFNNTWTAADFTNAGYVPKSVKGKFLHAKSDTGALEWVDDNNTWNAVSTSQAGYVPKLATGGGTIATQSTEYVLTFVSGGTGTITPTWKLLPANAFKNDNTWRNVYTNGTSRVGTGTGTKAINFVQGNNVTITYLAAGTSNGLSGSADYFGIKIDAVDTWIAWKGATADAAGTAGYMPAPTSADRLKFLRGDGSWVALSLTDHTHSVIINGATKTIAAPGGTAVDLGSYLPLAGGTMNTGAIINMVGNINSPATANDTVFPVMKIALNGFGDSKHYVAAIFFGNEPSINASLHHKGFFGYERTGSYDRGDFVWAINNATATANHDYATYSDIKMRLTKEGNLYLNGNLVANAGNITNKAATIGSSLTTIATIAGKDITAKIGSYASSSHTHKVKINGTEKTIAAPGGEAVNLGNYVPKIAGTGSVVAHKTSVKDWKGCKILIPGGYNAWMIAFTVRIYVNYQYTDIVFSGYHYGENHWYFPEASVIGGTRNYKVVMGYEGDSANSLYVWFGNADNTVLGYGGITIMNLHAGHCDDPDWYTTWTISDVDYANLTNKLYDTTTVLPAMSNHTHPLSIATDSGTNQLTLAASTKYKLTTGGSTYIFTTPPNTWRDVYTGGTLRIGNEVDTKAMNFASSNLTINYLAAGTSTGLSGNADYFTIGIEAKNWTGATSSAAGTAGYMPGAAVADRTKFLRGDGSWVELIASGSLNPSISNGSAANTIKITVGGENSSNYIVPYATYSQYPKMNSVNNNDMNTIKQAGFYYGYNMTNAAVQTISTFLILNYSGDWGNQVLLCSDGRIYHRRWINAGGVMDTTWQTIAYTSDIKANAVNVAGYVAAPTKAANANMVWKTDSDGNPAWRVDSNTQYYLTLNGTVNGTASSTNLGTFYAIATSDAAAKDLVWMRKADNSGYAWRTLGSNAFNSTSYLPLTGGTMTGSITIGGHAIYFGKVGNNAIMSFSSSYPNYGIWYNDTNVDTMTFSASGNANDATKADFAINGGGDGVLTSRGNKIWHAGNDGSGSGLDADTVDGFQVYNNGNGPTWGILTPIKSDGVLEVGKYIDFHNTSNDGKDYATRILVTLHSENVINIPTASGTFALTSQIPTVNNASLTLQTAGTTQTTFYANDSTNRTFNVTCANIGAAPAHDHPYVRTYAGVDVNPSSTYGYYAVMTTQSGITSDWWHILHMDWQGGANWRSELALPTQNRTGVYYRSDGNNWAWNSWIGLLDTSSTALTKAGNLSAANFYTTSDRSKKQNISPFSEHICKFQLKDTEKWHYGVIAQEVPEMFRDGKEGSYTVNYNSVLSYYIGILENKVRLLEEKINKLEGNG